MQDHCFIGVDVGKFEIQVAGLEPGQIVAGRIANTRSALTGWLKRLPAHSVLGMEATGGYQRLLADLAHGRGLTVYVLNPQRVHHYAKSLGQRGKTDRQDAQVIARYIAQEHERLHAYAPTDPALAELRQWQAARATVVRAMTMLRLSSQGQPEVIRQQAEPVLAQMRALAQAMERELVSRLRADPNLAKTYALLTGITGIGPLSGAALTVLFTRIAFSRADAVVAYSGLDPRPNDSGRKRGVRRLSKQGDKLLRTLLYNAASSAARTRVFKDYYQGLRAKGLASTAALVVLARRLLRIAYGVYRSQTAFDPSRAQHGITCT